MLRALASRVTSRVYFLRSSKRHQNTETLEEGREGRMGPAEGQCQSGAPAPGGGPGKQGRGGKLPRAHWLTLPGPDLALPHPAWTGPSGRTGLGSWGSSRVDGPEIRLMPNRSHPWNGGQRRSLDKSEGEKLSLAHVGQRVPHRDSPTLVMLQGLHWGEPGHWGVWGLSPTSPPRWACRPRVGGKSSRSGGGAETLSLLSCLYRCPESCCQPVSQTREHAGRFIFCRKT